MKSVFYDRNGMVGIIDSAGKNGYVLDVSKNDGENYINKKASFYSRQYGKKD